MILRIAARQLSDSGDKQSARKVLEFVFAREIGEHKLEVANFLGLGEIRIAVGDTPGEYLKFLKKDYERWARVIKASGVKAE